jgi:dihydroxyacetone kinase-like protein
MPVGTPEVLAWLRALQQVFAANRERLTDLDAAIGDADHGTNMDRGFTAVANALAAEPPTAIAGAFQTAAAVLIKTVGGASGPLFGTFFLRAAASCPGAAELDAQGVLAVFQAGTEGVRQRGKAAPGDKTMLDALMPAMDAMRAATEQGSGIAAILEAGAAAAEAGMQATIPMQARKGRASYLGERSIGHQDPGAASASLLIRAAADTWRTSS